MGISSRCNKKKYIFVDYFGTIVYRTVTDTQMEIQWVEYVIRRWPQLKDQNTQLLNKRQILYRNMYSRPGEVDFHTLCHEYALWLKDEYGICDRENDISKILFESEIYITAAPQYVNCKLYKLLKKEKTKGKKIILISDYHMPRQAYSIYLDFLGLSELFDGVYVSADYNETKREGTLYKTVLTDLKANSEEAIMIGDNRRSDVLMAGEAGIEAYHWMSLVFKTKNKIRNIQGYGRKNNVVSVMSRHIFGSSDFSEYGLYLYYFERQLVRELEKYNISKINFLSRGGYLLKCLFEKYMESEGKNIECNYMFNSRKLNHRAMQAYKYNTDEKFLNDYKEYIYGCAESRRLALVDEGWNNSSQEMISEICNIDTYGWYIGTFQKKKMGGCYRNGLLFDIDENGMLSKYYYIFRVNCRTYEQLLQAPHGSIVGLGKNEDGTWNFEEANEDGEPQFHKKYINQFQERIKMSFLMSYYWDRADEMEVSLESLVKLAMVTALFSCKKRNEVENCLEKNYVDNLTTVRNDGSLKQAKFESISLKKVITEPERLLRYLAKVQRKYFKNGILRCIYYPLAGLYYLYVMLSLKLRGNI